MRLEAAGISKVYIIMENPKTLVVVSFKGGPRPHRPHRIPTPPPPKQHRSRDICTAASTKIKLQNIQIGDVFAGF